MDVKAHWVPVAYVSSLGASYACAVALSRFSKWHPGTLTSEYPMRSMIQLGAALSTSPQLLSIFLWFLSTGSKNVLFVGILRFSAWLGAQFITRIDSPLHGTLSLAEGVLIAIWMLVVMREAPSKWRKRIFCVYTFNLILGFHLLAKYLNEGSNYTIFVATRCTNLLFSLLYDALAATEFNSITISIESATDYSKV